jgi:RHS repeat-associated protein
LSANTEGGSSQDKSPFDPPQLNLPKGGGAIRGIGEKFAANPVTGTGSLTVPIYTSPGRLGFGPQLSLSYDSGSGNTPFGFGWSLPLPAITRKTDKGLPQYVDAQESDIFILSGAEDLMPSLTRSGSEWVRDITPLRSVYGEQYEIHRYRPRVEGLFARIERWINVADPQDTFWRSISKDNTTTWYGKTPESRIADPADPARIFSWLICDSYDDKGSVVVYEYKPENSDGVDLTQAHERNRTDRTRSAGRYIQHVLYGNRTPYFPDLTATAPVPLPTDWCFELVFDYGEHDLQNPVPSETGQLWDCRLDPFSTYRSTFEVRTYRLCRRALMFHHFAAESNVGLNCLVRSTDFVHSPTAPAEPSQPFYSFLLSATQTGYSRNAAGGYLSNSLPPLEFEYTAAMVDETVREVDTESLENLPSGLDGSNYRWTDLDGEGLAGILTEQGGCWFYKANLTPVNQQVIDGVQYTLPRFAPVEVVARKPSLAALNSGRQQLMALSGGGPLSLVEFGGPTPGFFERTQDGDWESFTAFQSLPVVDWQSSNLKFIDLTGDGLPDLLISEDNVFWWHTSLGEDGFGPAQRAPQALDEENGPKLVFSDGTESIFLADISGDGLTDLIRIRNGELCYWPNLGYGRFGARVTMDQAPWFDTPDIFDGRRIRLADIDGSGTADIIYIAGSAVHLYFNQSGNGWGSRRTLSYFPPVESVSSATALDLLGNGTACLVWSSPLPSNARRQMRYIDLMGGQKPHLLVSVSNNLGAETQIEYAPSTKFYVADKLAGTPWVTRLPFPVHVVEQVQTYDYVSRNLFVTRYAYHHGYYDVVEREFRGFGRVDQWDTEEFATLANATGFPQSANVDTASNVPPVCTKTWFHTGAFIDEASISKHMEHEYYSEGDSLEAIAGLTAAQLEAMLLDDTLEPTTILLPDGSRLTYNLSGEELREACRALRGSILRQEVYGLDGTEASDRPYSASERNYTIEVLQPQGPNQFGVFFAHPRETIDFHYERKLFKVVGKTLADPSAPPPGVKDAADPRVTHSVTLAVDPFGNVLQSAAVGYGRRYLDPALVQEDQTKQSAILSTCTENAYTNAVLSDDLYRTPLQSESNTYELIQVQPDSTHAEITNLFRFDELKTKVQAAGDGAHDIVYENLYPSGLQSGQAYRRLIGRTRAYYRPDDMGAAAGNPKAVLALGKLESLALPGSSYKLALTPGLISQVYQRGATALLPTPASVLGSVAGDGGGYVDLDGDGHWWIPSGRIYYLPGAPSAPQEKNQALQHFFLPRRFEDPFGNTTSADYDHYDLLVVRTTDAVTNVVATVNDYRVLAPALMTDPNGNRAAVSFDILGLVVATAVMGKTTEKLGDLLTGFSADLTQAQIDGFYDANDPHTVAGPLLGNATTRVVYDVHRFLKSRLAAPTDPSQWQPAFAATIARETHLFDLGPGQQSNLQISFSYSDGYGREIQKKIQAEPGPAIDGGPVINPRWVGSGWTIFNNKGKPVRQYEPFFSQLPANGHQFEFGVQVGVSPILCYDPVERVVATVHANHAYEKIVFDPWHQARWDVNDTVLQTDPAADPDVGDFFQRLAAADYSPTWYAQRSAGGLGPLEQDAATKAAAHANTPTIAHFDTLGRTFLTIADNAAGGKYPTRVELDIQNNQRSVADALRRKVMVYDYDMLGGHLHQASVDAGERWTLNDATGKAIRAWDSRGHNFRTSYDPVHRPINLFVLGTDPLNSDSRTTAGEMLYERVGYGEGQANDQALNLRTRIYQHNDAAGVVTNLVADPATKQNVAFDFKGNLLGSSRQFLQDHKALPDWAKSAPAFLPDVFVGVTQYDALNRTVAATAPDGSVVHPTYNEANLLKTVSANLQGAATATSFVSDIDYNAKGQRTLVEYGNGARTAYTYDPETFRMTELKTTRTSDKAVLQDLAYSYDPVGNITSIGDAAQQTIYFSNQVVTANADYTYDAIYRLMSAAGREHIGQLSQPQTTWDETPRINQPLPTDGQAMRNYVENYSYDAVGNILQIVHQAMNGNWTRTYAYDEPNTSPTNNRLTSTTVGALKEPYTYDVHGNMTQMPHLPQLAWDFEDQLASTQRQVVNNAPGETTYYVYDASGQRVRKVTQSGSGTKTKERIYLGGYEVYREYASDGSTATLERQTLHVMDGKRRVALVETNTTSAAAPILRYQFDNHLGSASLELDTSGAIISYEEYYPYGSTSFQAVPGAVQVSPKRYRYTGKERDEETGFYYHGARYYAPWLGRWTACDPQGMVDGTNLYGYVRDNPICRLDPTGHQGFPTFTKETETPAAVAQGRPVDAEPRGADLAPRSSVLGDPRPGFPTFTNETETPAAVAQGRPVDAEPRGADLAPRPSVLRDPRPGLPTFTNEIEMLAAVPSTEPHGADLEKKDSRLNAAVPEPEPLPAPQAANWAEGDLRNELNRATLNGWLPFFDAAALQNDFDTNFLLAIASRETNMRDMRGDYHDGAYHGFGIMQVDLGTDPRFAAAWTPNQVERSIQRGTEILAGKRDSLAARNIDDLQATAAAYNAGAGPVIRSIEHGADPDQVTTDRNYGSDVMARMAAFARLRANP